MSESDVSIGLAADPVETPSITRSEVRLFAVAVGVMVTNLFASQTLVDQIGSSVHMAQASVGLVAMATLLGYAAGLFFLVPLADIFENRKLTLRLLICAIVAAVAVALAPDERLLLVSLFALGAACSGIQILVPLAASMAQAERRGRVVGDVMSGLMAGILLSRPLASLIASQFGWRAFFELNALSMAVLAGVLAVFLPRSQPAGAVGYGRLIASMWRLLIEEPVLRYRSVTASLGMAAFSLFWTAVALRLTQPPFNLGQLGIAAFALVGVGGVISTPIAGRAGDRGWQRAGTLLAHLFVVASFAVAAWAGHEVGGSDWSMLCLMGTSAIMLDVGVVGEQTLGRHAINLLRPEARGRINGLFVGLFFLGGAVGATAAGLAWTYGGWRAVCVVGAAFGAACLLADVGRR